MSLPRALAVFFAVVATGASALTILDQLHEIRFEVFDLFYDGRGQELLITTLVGILVLVFLLLSQVAAPREELEARRRDELVNHASPGPGASSWPPWTGSPS